MRRGCTILLAFFLVIPAFAQESDAWPQGKAIEDIVFEGLNHVSAQELRGVVEPFIGRPYTDSLFLEIQGRLYALEYFDLLSPNLEVSASQGVIIRFKVTERSIISSISFTGNSGLRQTELLGTITIKVGDVVLPLKISVDEAALKILYLEKGYPDIKVSSELRDNGNGSMALIFRIEEGDKITVAGFVFEGNTVFSGRTLTGQLSLKAKGLFVDGAFQESKLTADIATLTQYYHDRGYIDAKVTDVIRNISKDSQGNNSLTITFKIEEGRLYTFGGFNFEGNVVFPTDQLDKLISSKTGEAISARKVEEDFQRVSDLYYENGYIFNTINREEIRNTETGVISYKIVIVERGRAYIEHIYIVGNTKTDEEVILREIPLEPGDIFSKSKIVEGLRNLYNLQYFSGNIIPEIYQGSADNLMDLVITVEEISTTDLNFGMSFSGSSDPDAFPISLTLGFADRNFLGKGNSITAQGSAATDSQSLVLGYTQNWLFGVPLSMGVNFAVQHKKQVAFMGNLLFEGNEDDAFPNGFNSYSEYRSANKTPASEYLMPYDQVTLSLGVSMGYRWLTPVGNLGLGSGISSAWDMKSYDADLYRPFDPLLRLGNKEFTPALSFYAMVYLDQRDIYYDPSNGYYVSQRLGFHGILPEPMEREHYLRSDTKAEYFLTFLDIPITETYDLKFILGIHTGLSFIFPQPWGPQTNFIEQANQLAIDGVFNARGWTGRQLFTGNALWENWLEIRIPVVPGLLAVDIFFDAAALKPTPTAFFSEFHIQDMYFSLGFGIRLAIPQLPLRLMLGRRFYVDESGKVKWPEGNAFDGALDFIFSVAIPTQ
ncbi:MAG: outer membrane protein assembly factor BamA [Treponema sp.]|jgi:outer membrane protein insertion porin family|nr:outer membrane protein assembly factor BamA [Treponema sp.]